MLCDDRPKKLGQFRVFLRFFSDDLAVARFPWEFQRGTGSMVVAVALAHEGRLQLTRGKEDVLFEWGGLSSDARPLRLKNVAAAPRNWRKSV
jgi:hypothetical protein